MLLVSRRREKKKTTTACKYVSRFSYVVQEPHESTKRSEDGFCYVRVLVTADIKSTFSKKTSRSQALLRSLDHGFVFQHMADASVSFRFIEGFVKSTPSVT